MLRLLCTLAIALAAVDARAADAPLWLMVGPAELTAAADQLVRHREAEGMRTLVANSTIEAALAAAPAKPAYLLIIGDDDPENAGAPYRMPAQQRKPYRWRAVQAMQFASDSLWGDLTGDQTPDIPVGRLPARTPEQVRELCRKIIAYETATPTAADLRLLVWAGCTKYGAMIDQMANTAVVSMLEASAPAWCQPWLLIGDPANPFCGWPASQPETFTEQMKRGSVLNVLIGHGYVDHFFSMSTKDYDIGYTSEHARPLLGNDNQPCAPMIIISCLTGSFAGTSPCMAEDFLMMPGGPVATIGATAESHPLTNFYTAVGLLNALSGKHRRLGDFWLAAQRQMLRAHSPLVQNILLESEGKLENTIDVAKLKRDQLLMYALLGDPATRLRLPRKFDASCRRTEAGWQWQATLPPAAAVEAGLRPATTPVGAAPTGTDEQQALQRLNFANARYGFTPTPCTANGAIRTGTVDQPGILRITATQPGKISVATINVRE